MTGPAGKEQFLVEARAMHVPVLKRDLKAGQTYLG